MPTRRRAARQDGRGDLLHKEREPLFFGRICARAQADRRIRSIRYGKHALSGEQFDHLFDLGGRIVHRAVAGKAVEASLQHALRLRAAQDVGDHRFAESALHFAHAAHARLGRVGDVRRIEIAQAVRAVPATFANEGIASERRVHPFDARTFETSLADGGVGRLARSSARAERHRTCRSCELRTVRARGARRRRRQRACAIRIFAEIAQDIGAQAVGRAAIAHHAVEHAALGRLHAPGLFFGKALGGPALLDEIAAGGDIAVAPQKQAFGRLAVAAGTARLLIVRLDAFRHVVMDHIAHVGLVDAHAERIGRHHDRRIVVDETALAFQARVGGHARMVSYSRHALAHEPCGKRIDVFARAAVTTCSPAYGRRRTRRCGGASSSARGVRRRISDWGGRTR